MGCGRADGKRWSSALSRCMHLPTNLVIPEAGSAEATVEGGEPSAADGDATAPAPDAPAPAVEQQHVPTHALSGSR